MKKTIASDKELSKKDWAFLVSQQELKDLGLDEVGYVKPYKVKDKIAWVLHAADGTAISVQSNADAAHVSAQHQDIDIVSLH